MVRIVIFIKIVSRSSGGLSSAWDLAESLVRKGNDVTVILKKKSIQYKEELNRVASVPATKVLLNRRYSDEFQNLNLRNLSKGFYWWLVGNDRKVRAAVRKADMVLDCYHLKEVHLGQIRSESSALLMYNHAGSAETFENLWLPRDMELESKDPESRYLEFCSRYDSLLFQSEGHEKDYLSKYKTEWKKCRTFTLPPSCEEDKVLAVKSEEKSILDKDKFNVVIVGSIQHVKGIDLALQVLNNVASESDKVHFHFVGKYYDDDSELGVYYKSLIEYIREFNLSERLTFHDFKENYLEYMNDADLIFQSSRAEGVSRILRESMLLGKLILAFNILGTKNLLKNDASAILVEPYQCDLVAEKILEIMSPNQHDKNEEIKKGALETYLSRNSKKVYLERLGEIFSKESISVKTN